MIVDANRMDHFLAEPAHPDARPIHEWIRKKGRLVFSTGGKFGSELGDRATRRLTDYARRGGAKRVDQSELRKGERQLIESGNLKSDDAHVLALAKVSGARLLYTGDRLLMEDFTDREIINNPRGKVYSGAGNRDLLNRVACPP